VASEPLSLLAEAPPRLTAFRWSSYDVPFWARPNNREGRWNVLDGTCTQYWSLSPDAAWAELIRHEGLATEAELDLVRMPVWVCHVSSAFIVDLQREDERERFGITYDELISDDWSPCQALAGRLRAQHQGIIAPCAALPAHPNLTLFGPRRSIKWMGTPGLASVIAAGRVAIGRPPEGLIDKVRRPVVPVLPDTLF
jgi:RES domain-containing protein